MMKFSQFAAILAFAALHALPLSAADSTERTFQQQETAEVISILTAIIVLGALAFKE